MILQPKRCLQEVRHTAALITFSRETNQKRLRISALLRFRAAAGPRAAENLTLLIYTPRMKKRPMKIAPITSTTGDGRPRRLSQE